MADLTLTSSPLPSPFPSPSPSTSTSTSPSWHYPYGPSARYHKRSRPTYHTRFKSVTTIPIAPNLSTERRAERKRAQSIVATATMAPYGSLTPPLSDSSPSPHPVAPRRQQLHSYTSAPIPTMSTLPGHAPGPMTPAKPVNAFHEAHRPQDSPFSDYFTDEEARSTTFPSPSSPPFANYHHYHHHTHAPSSTMQQLLVRMSKVQAQIMRLGEEEPEFLNVVGRRMSEIEREWDDLHAQTRRPPELEDSGLFLDDETPLEEEEEEGEGQQDGYFGHGGGGGDEARPVEQKREAVEDEVSDITPENKQAEQDYQILEAQRILENVTRANEELRRRHAELVQLNDAHVLQMDDKETELETLRSENEALRSDLGFDHSELLFLKLRLKAMEVEVGGLDEVHQDECVRNAPYAAREGVMRVKTGRVLRGLEQWRSDWRDVDARLRSRRGRYGVLSAEHRDAMLKMDLEDNDEGGAESQWRVETVQEGQGRVSSITLRRFDAGDCCSPLKQQMDGTTEDSEASRRLTSNTSTPRPEPDKPSSNYVDSTTQTDPAGLRDDDDDDDGYDDDNFDCAITTSPSTPEQQLSPVIQPLMALGKTAWSELWEGLEAVAGMGDEGI
ncbi:hypothetical protein BAUCODRAFT_70624 [Baudoinia panamericana UAMH 10762]|uniref:Uncharacterized protein n=1 Tax=Baudoinia panamericana (strain UAMH 10762) TaxID=717646 RepID=M2NCX4_BAUPA|nr:uncharacterized protein BAUCODRAFT_70624 [Baudoinia panamericana UAMH 10762]EMC96780.1 hypothetical protein BAUCODRAFT_70624 [Baudoinia panamericana UAMH 10762]